jgi:hypothetical protein
MQNEEIIYTQGYWKRPSDNPEGFYPYRAHVLFANLHGKHSRRKEGVIQETRIKNIKKKTGH